MDSIKKYQLEEYFVISSLISGELCEDFAELLSAVMDEEESKYFSIDKFNDNMENVDVVVANGSKEALKFKKDANGPVFEFNPLVSDINFNHQMLKETLAVFGDDSFTDQAGLYAISEGYRDNLAERIIGNGSDYQPYLDEKIVAKQIELIVGSDVLAKSYFQNQPELLKSGLGKNANQIIGMIGDNYLNRQLRSESSLGDIEIMLIDSFNEKPNLSEETVAEFNNNVYTNPAMFLENENMYQSLHEVKDYLKTKNRVNTI